MNSDLEFIRCIADNPSSMAPRQVYADWLEERGECARAEFIRLGVELAEREPKLPPLLKARTMRIPAMPIVRQSEPSGLYSQTIPSFRQSMRFEIVTNDRPPDAWQKVEVFVPKEGSTWIDAAVLEWTAQEESSNFVAYDVQLELESFRMQASPERLAVDALRTSLAELLTPDRRREWTMRGLPEEWDMPGLFVNKHYICPEGGNCGYNGRESHIFADFRAGFPEILTLRFEEYERHYKALIGAMPVRIVNITSWPTTSIGWSSGVELGDYNARCHVWLAAEFPGPDPANPIRYTLPTVASAGAVAVE